MVESVKPDLLILSDLWGKHKAAPIENYTRLLEDRYSIRYYDSTHLAEIPVMVKNQTDLHQAFINGGIDLAVKNLIIQEPNTQHLLGLSVGGVIAWRYALQHQTVKTLTAISATRLRYESQKPNCTISLYYGELDPYQPSEEWYRQLGLSAHVITNESHEIYRNEAFLYNCLNLIE